MIGLIWAQAHTTSGRPVIGAGNSIPWRIPEDFAHFKAVTAGHPIVMGRRTWESLPRRPLPGRTNIVITRSNLLDIAPLGQAQPHNSVAQADGTAIHVASSLPQALALATETPGSDEVWVMGGERVYAQAITYADRLEVTEVDLQIEGDTFAPRVDPDHWHDTSKGEWQTSSAPPGLRYRHIRYIRDLQQNPRHNE